jgi:hypothetical protein
MNDKWERIWKEMANRGTVWAFVSREGKFNQVSVCVPAKIRSEIFFKL